MSRRKYKLSPEGVEKLMKRLEAVAQEELKYYNEFSEGLLEAEITTNFIEIMTGIKNIEEVIRREEELTKNHVGLVSMYGFDSMYDMYLYAMSCDIVPNELLKAKDYSKLTPVKRKIVRNGKETEVTVWINPNKDSEDEGNKDSVTSSKGQNVSSRRKKRRHAKDTSATIRGEKTKLNPKELADLKLAIGNTDHKGNKPFVDTSDYYLVLNNEEGGIVGIVGYSESGDYLTMDFYRSTGRFSGVAAQGFFELLRLAVDKGKGVKMEDTPQARYLFSQSGLEQKGDYWVIEYKELKSLINM